MVKKRVEGLLIALVLLTGGWWIYHRWTESRVNTLQATGTVEATTVQVNARTAGPVDQLLVNEGDRVKKGQLMAVMTRNDLVAQRERDAMAVAEAEAKWRDLVSGPREPEVIEAVANVNQARTSAEQAETNLTRARSLYEQGALAKEALEESEAEAQVKADQVQAAEARLSLLQAGNRPQTITAAWAELERSKAVLKASNAMLADLKLSSPLSGVVLSRNYEPGEYVTAGAVLYTVADLDHLWVKVYIPTDDLPRVKLGQRVDCTVSGYAGHFTGYVEHINSQGEYTPKTIQTKKERANVVFGVKVRLNNPGGVLKPGMPADVVFGETGK